MTAYIHQSEITRQRSSTQRAFDLLSELTGFFRLSACRRGGSFALGAKVKSPSLLSLGNGVVVQHGAILHCGGKAWSGYAGGIRLEDGVNIGPYCVIYGAGGVIVEAFAHLGPGVKLMTQGGNHDMNRLSRTPTHKFDSIVIGTGSWVGTGTVMTAGARLGRCVTVAPNSVVSSCIPDYAVIAGNPARVILVNDPIL